MTLDQNVRTYEGELRKNLETLATRHQIEPISEERYRELIELAERILARIQNVDIKSIGRNYSIHLRDERGDYSENPLEDVEKLKREIESNPDDGELNYQLAIAYNEARLYCGARSINRAIILWRKIKEIDPRFLVRSPFLFPWDNKDKTYNNLNDILSASTFIDKIPDYRLVFLLAYASCQLGEDLEAGYKQKAIGELRKASELGYQEASITLMSDLVAQTYGGTFILLSKKERETLDVNSYYKSGDKHFAEGDYIKAIEEYKKGIFYFPPHSKTLERIFSFPINFFGAFVRSLGSAIRGH